MLSCLLNQKNTQLVNERSNKRSSSTTSTTAFSFSPLQKRIHSHERLFLDEKHVPVEYDDNRHCSTTSGISSDGSANSIISCCNNTEECRFNNSTKFYDSVLYQKRFSTKSRKSRYNVSMYQTDGVSSISSTESCKSNCSICSCKTNHSEIEAKINHMPSHHRASQTNMRSLALEKL